VKITELTMNFSSFTADLGAAAANIGASVTEAAGSASKASKKIPDIPLWSHETLLMQHNYL